MSTETQRAEFEAFVLEKTGRDVEYHGRAGTTGLAFAYACWRAAQSSQAAEIEHLKDVLRFVERWANHHGAKPTLSAVKALSVIQHHPAIKEITKSYADGVVPGTRDPYAEIEALKAKLATYEAPGVTCQTFGHVIGACAECNTHEESKEAELAALKADIATYVRAASEQATEIEALRKELTTASAHLHRARRNARIDVEEMAYTQALKGIDALLDSAMQTKEAS